jgi:hypothetical protein
MYVVFFFSKAAVSAAGDSRVVSVEQELNTMFDVFFTRYF